MSLGQGERLGKGKEEGGTTEGLLWGERGRSLCLTACCLSENKQTSDYDINANLNVSQCGAWLSQ